MHSQFNSKKGICLLYSAKKNFVTPVEIHVNVENNVSAFVRRAGCLPSVALSLVAHARGLGSINVTWWRMRITLHPVWDHRVSTGPSCMYGTIVLIAERRMCPTPNCSTGLDRIVMCGLVRSQSMQCNMIELPCAIVHACACVSVCVCMCVRACVRACVFMCVNGGFWRASMWGGGLVRRKRCANMALESPEVGFNQKFYVFVVSRVGAIGGFVLSLLPLLLLLLLLLPLLLLLL